LRGQHVDGALDLDHHRFMRYRPGCRHDHRACEQFAIIRSQQMTGDERSAETGVSLRQCIERAVSFQQVIDSSDILVALPQTTGLKHGRPSYSGLIDGMIAFQVQVGDDNIALQSPNDGTDGFDICSVGRNEQLIAVKVQRGQCDVFLEQGANMFCTRFVQSVGSILVRG
jgi:hypothetical protein